MRKDSVEERLSEAVILLHYARGAMRDGELYPDTHHPQIKAFLDNERLLNAPEPTGGERNV